MKKVKNTNNSICKKNFAEWNNEMKVLETYPKWEVLSDALSRVKKWDLNYNHHEKH